MRNRRLGSLLSSRFKNSFKIAPANIAYTFPKAIKELDIDGEVIYRVEQNDQSLVYYLNSNGRKHRRGGWAVYDKLTGREEFHENGYLHNERGPAVVSQRLGNEYWVHGKSVTAIQHALLFGNLSEAQVIDLLSNKEALYPENLDKIKKELIKLGWEQEKIADLIQVFEVGHFLKRS